ncbi:hypothetical protein GSI_04932 [Ganoderma sinense ZZ0214-1]|uniref:Uncharacterized protein n=1 Tax=Ganoderma sinense ZZ0214-1 TaxID=1077348 RepID=A0A2G8SGA7_9APHY|nr:hypothetical protein GSI_04932 [Ganoderma sinense ZZ0214-1]
MAGRRRSHHPRCINATLIQTRHVPETNDMRLFQSPINEGTTAESGYTESDSTAGTSNPGRVS